MTPARLFLAALLVVGVEARAQLLRAQENLVQTARPYVASREDLIAALRQAWRRPPIDAETELALIATWGEPVTGWLIQVAAGESNEFLVRAAAMHALYYSRPRAAIAVLTMLAAPRPLDSDSGLSIVAMNALQSFPYPELVGFWRPLLNHASTGVRQEALTGLSFAGTEADIPLILAVQGGDDLARARREALARLQLPSEARGAAIFGAPPGPEGRFVPSSRWLGLTYVRAYLCARQTCPREP
jgi:hypothetical protein